MPNTHRGLVLASSVSIATLALIATSTAGAAGHTQHATAGAASSHHVASDFDGDGRADVAIGEPNTGTVVVRLTSAGGPTHTQVLTAPNATSHDTFGAALAVGDFNGDGFADVAVGAPGYQAADADGEGQGEVVIYNGSATGLQYAAKIIGPSNFDDSSSFGAALAATDTNRDGKADLAVGNPDLGDGDDPDGAVTFYLGASGGLSTTSSHSWQSAKFECGCEFGAALAFGDLNGDGRVDLAIGTPGYGFTKAQHGGSVAIVDGKAAGLVGAPVAKVIGGIAAGANGGFGSALAIGKVNGDKPNELAVGAPDVKVGSANGAGEVVVFRGRKAGPGTSHQYSFTAASSGVPGSPGTNAAFGSALWLRDLTGDNRADLAIGVPGAKVSGFAHAGAVDVLRSVGGALTGTSAKQYTEATKGVPGKVRKNDRFGAALCALNPTPTGAVQLYVGAPGALGGSTRSGTVTVFRTNKTGLKVAGIKQLHDAMDVTGAGFGTEIR